MGGGRLCSASTSVAERTDPITPNTAIGFPGELFSAGALLLQHSRGRLTNEPIATPAGPVSTRRRELAWPAARRNKEVGMLKLVLMALGAAVSLAIVFSGSIFVSPQINKIDIHYVSGRQPGW